MKRLIKLGLLALALVLVLLAAFALAFSTNAGLRFVLARADAALSSPAGGGLKVATAQGSLAGGFVLEGVVLELGGTRVTIERLQGAMQPLPLLIGKLGMVALELDGVAVVLPPEPDPEPFVLPPRIDLPLHIAVERFALRGLRVSAGATPLLELEALSGRLGADAHGFRFEDARISAEGLDAEGSLAMANAQPYPMEGALRLTLERTDLPPIAGNAVLAGRLEALRLGFRLEAPLAARVELALDDVFATRRIAGRVEFHDADLAPLFAALEDWRFDADLALAGTLAAPRVDGQLAARGAGLPALRAELGARLAGRVLQLERLALTAAGRPTRLDARGRMTLDGGDLPFALEVRVTDPALPTLSATLAGDLVQARGRVTAQDRAGALEAELELEARAAHARLAGTVTAWPLPAGIVLGADAFSTELGAGKVEFRANGGLARGKLRARYELLGRADQDRVTLEQLGLALLDGQIDGSGHLDLGGAGRWQATLRARGLDPRGIDPRFPGRLAARLELSGTPSAPVIELADLSGELRGRPLAGHARLSPGRAPELALLGLPRFALDELVLSAGAARLQAAATASAARLELDAPELADLLPNARGDLEVKATRDADGALGVHSAGRGLQLGVGRLATLDVTLAAPADGAVKGELAAAGLSVGDIALDTLKLQASGSRDALVLELTAARTGTAFAAAVRGALRDGRFAGELTHWELAPVDAKRWTLAAPAALLVGRGGARLDQACAGDGKARACVDGSWHPLDPWQATVAVQRVGLAALQSYLPRRLVYAGELDLTASVAGIGPTLGAVRAELDLSSGSVDATVRRGQATTTSRLVGFSGGKVSLERDAQRLAIGADLALDGGGKLDLTLEAAGGGLLDARPLTGRIVAQVEQFALLPVLLPEVRQLSGKLAADLAVSGTVAAPRFAGHASFRGGSASVPRFGIELSAVELELDGGGDAIDVTGNARAGGTLAWQAKLRHGANGWEAQGTLRGDRFRALVTPEARVIASPDLALAYADDRLSVTGTVTVPEARIAPRSLASAVQASGDEVLVGDAGPTGVEPLFALEARVHVALGDAVEFEGFGLKADVEGGLTLIDKPGSLTLASGELALVNGKYEAYGQQLAIQRGKLLFSGGPVADPGLDVRAERVIDRIDTDDVTVGIDVRGTLRRPELTLFSDPAMSSSEQLSYLVLGRSLTESTEGDQQLLGDATQSMKLSGGELIAQQIGRRIGLDEVRIEDDGDQAEAQLWLGTYLSPRLFVSYGIGLFEDFYSARVRYDISTKWSVEAESGRESSADFKYTIER